MTTDQHAENRKLIEEASTRIEGIFKNTGRILPMFHVISGDNANSILAMPPDSSKDDWAAMMRNLFKRASDVHRYVFIDEAWTLGLFGETKPIDDATMAEINQHGVRSRADREEAVIFSAEDRNIQTMAARPIIRPSKGKAKLGPLKFLEGFDGMEGRMVGLMAGAAGGTKQ